MLQSGSTASPPRLLGQPPDSLRIIWASFSWVSAGQPALVASFGSQETSPHLNWIWGCFFASALAVSSLSLGHGVLGFCGSAGATAAAIGAFASAGMFKPRARRVKDNPQPIMLFNDVSPVCWGCDGAVDSKTAVVIAASDYYQFSRLGSFLGLFLEMFNKIISIHGYFWN